MKTKLLKLALCAMALLPMGAWADDIDFGSEASVSETTLWTFDDLTTGDKYYTSRDLDDSKEFPKLGNAYLRTVKTDRSFVVSDVTASTSITLIDGTTQNITKYLHVNADAGDISLLTPTGTANTYTNTHKATGVFAFNAEVAGSIYVYAKGATAQKTLRIYHSEKVGSDSKLSSVTFSITNADDMMILSYTSSKKGTFFIGGAGTLCDIYAVQFVPSDIAVSAATSFNITAVPFESMTGICNVPNGLVYRASSGRSMSIQNASKTITFSDGASIEITKKLVTTSSIDGPTENTPNASSVGGSKATPMLAFKTTKKGTVYVKMAATAESVNGRIYWGNGSGTPANPVNTTLTKNTETELSWSSDEAGSFFIGATGACEIYAVRFVPNYTISYNANGGTGAMSSNTVASGNNQTLTANAFTKDNYTFSNWTADVNVTIGGETVTAGNAIADGATIQNVTSNIALTAQWTEATYTVTHTLTGATKTSGATSATYNTNYSAVYTANDEYVLPSTIDVTIGGEAKTVDTDYIWDRANGTVTIPAEKVTGNIEITVTATKAAVVTKWNFEEYMTDYNLFGTSNTQDVKEFTDGLYLHTRDADSDNHKVKAATATIASTMDNDITSQTKIYSRGSTYPAISLMSGNVTVSATDASANVSCNGISYKAPANGTFYYTVYTETKNAHVYSYKNKASEPTDNSINPGSKGGAGGEFSIEVLKDDVIYITTSANPMYLLEAMFVPTSPESTHTTVTFKAAGKGWATFSSTKNYTVPVGVTAYYVSNVDETEKKATMTSITAGNEIPACTGVILYKEGVETEDVEVQMTTAGKTNAVDNHLRANIVSYNLPANDGTNYNYTLAYDGAPVFKHVASENPGTLAAGKAFLRTTVVASSRSINLVFDEDETTGISTVKVQNEEVTNGEYYDLMGRRVANPTKGLYIVNGKKVFIK